MEFQCTQVSTCLRFKVQILSLFSSKLVEFYYYATITPKLIHGIPVLNFHLIFRQTVAVTTREDRRDRNKARRVAPSLGQSYRAKRSPPTSQTEHPPHHKNQVKSTVSSVYLSSHKSHDKSPASQIEHILTSPYISLFLLIIVW